MFERFIALRFHRFYFSMLFLRTQVTKGMSNEVVNEPDKYYIFWDLDNCSLEQAEQTLSDVQINHKLADIFIVSDKINSYRGFCFSKRNFKTFIDILFDTKYVDYSFISWTVRRHKAILRTASKLNRPTQQEVVAKLEGYEKYELPKERIKEIYETCYGKMPHSIRNYKR
jgi:hypothetical protein